MFRICYAIKPVTTIEYQKINGFYIEIGPLNPQTKANQIKMNVQKWVLVSRQCFFSESK